jgi:hypothetical protein
MVEEIKVARPSLGWRRERIRFWGIPTCVEGVPLMRGTPASRVLAVSNTKTPGGPLAAPAGSPRSALDQIAMLPTRETKAVELIRNARR